MLYDINKKNKGIKMVFTEKKWKSIFKSKRLFIKKRKKIIQVKKTNKIKKSKKQKKFHSSCLTKKRNKKWKKNRKKKLFFENHQSIKVILFAITRWINFWSFKFFSSYQVSNHERIISISNLYLYILIIDYLGYFHY